MQWSSSSTNEQALLCWKKNAFAQAAAVHPRPFPMQERHKVLMNMLQVFSCNVSKIEAISANVVLPRRLGFRSDQQALCAAQHHAGVREGNCNAGLRLRLTLANMDVAFRQHLNLQLSLPSTLRAAEEPAMAGAGKRGCKRGQHRESPEVAVDGAGDDEEKPQEGKRKLEKE